MAFRQRARGIDGSRCGLAREVAQGQRSPVSNCKMTAKILMYVSVLTIIRTRQRSGGVARYAVLSPLLLLWPRQAHGMQIRC